MIIYLESRAQRVMVAQSPEPEAHEKSSRQSNIQNKKIEKI
jgi:hypothetical protein